jgi:5-methylcytosine-specific restriction endonuclease McrA
MLQDHETLNAYHRAYRVKHAEKIREQAKARRQKNHAKKLEQEREWRQKNAEKIHQNGQVWRDSHREEYRAKKRAYRQRTIEAARFRQRKYMDKNREKIRAKARESSRANRTKKRAYEHQYLLVHPEKAAMHKARKQAWNIVNHDKIRAQERARQTANLSVYVAKNAERRARKNGAPINDLTHAQWLEIQEIQAHRCYYCHKRCKGHLTQDHITPLSQGGSHTLHNVIAACRNCNSQKGARKPPIPVQPLLLTLASARKKKAS